MKPNIGQGDKGKTHLPGGERGRDKVWKDSAQVEAYGDLDELNSHIGFLRAYDLPEEVDAVLEMIQDHIFRAEFHVSAAGTKYEGSSVPSFGMGEVRELEAKLEAIEAKLPELTHFILPGGTKEAALADIARTVSRRVERRIVTWRNDVKNPQPVHEAVQAYINRLSDYFMALSRYLNSEAGVEPPAWKGREKRI